MNWKHFIVGLMACVFLLVSCESEVTEIQQGATSTSQQTGMRFRINTGSSVSNIQLYVFQSLTPGDTTLYSAPSLLTGAALLQPVPLKLPMGKYVVVAVANSDNRMTNPIPGTTTLNSVLAALTTVPQSNGKYSSAGEWFWGINRNVRIGAEATSIITLERCVGKVVLTYKYGYPHLIQLVWGINGLSSRSFFNGQYSILSGSDVEIIHQATSSTGSILIDSMFVLPTIINQSTLLLSETKAATPGINPKEYTYLLATKIKPNYITYIKVNAGESSSVNIEQKAWSRDTNKVILDESPSAVLNVDVGDFTDQQPDTSYLQSIGVRISVNQGVVDNYAGSFNITLTKAGILFPTSITKTVTLKELNGKLVTTAPIKLSPGNYTLTNYGLRDVEGLLPDPANKAISKAFTVTLDYQIIDISLDGRQGVENELMKKVVEDLHGTSQADGSIFPGAAPYTLPPLGSSLPPSNAGITNSLWNVSLNNRVQKIPIRGEWRIYSITYRGGGSASTNLNGVLPTLLKQLKQLTLIDLSYNILTGGLPTLNNMSVLSTIILNNNQLSGNIDRLSSLTTLKRISLENNGFSNDITTGLAPSANQLSYISLNNNQFTGPITVIPINSPFIFVANNKFSGQLPAYTILLNQIGAQCDFRRNNFTCYQGNIATSTVVGRINPQKLMNIYQCP